MADYHPLISRAVNGLTKNTGETRRALYERARTALVNQLRGVEPALDEFDITRERLALEEAIREVEGGASKPPSATPRGRSHRRSPIRACAGFATRLLVRRGWARQPTPSTLRPKPTRRWLENNRHPLRRRLRRPKTSCHKLSIPSSR